MDTYLPTLSIHYTLSQTRDYFSQQLCEDCAVYDFRHWKCKVCSVEGKVNLSQKGPYHVHEVWIIARPSINRLFGTETVASKLHQTIPRRKATVSLDNKTLKCSLAVHFQSYPSLAEKGQLATASAVFGNYDSTQSATPILVTQNTELIQRKAELIRLNFGFRNMKCIQSDRNILGLSVQLVLFV